MYSLCGKLTCVYVPPPLDAKCAIVHAAPCLTQSAAWITFPRATMPISCTIYHAWPPAETMNLLWQVLTPCVATHHLLLTSQYLGVPLLEASPYPPQFFQSHLWTSQTEPPWSLQITTNIWTHMDSCTLWQAQNILQGHLVYHTVGDIIMPYMTTPPLLFRRKCDHQNYFAREGLLWQTPSEDEAMVGGWNLAGSPRQRKRPDGNLQGCLCLELLMLFVHLCWLLTLPLLTMTCMCMSNEVKGTFIWSPIVQLLILLTSGDVFFYQFTIRRSCIS